MNFHQAFKFELTVLKIVELPGITILALKEDFVEEKRPQLLRSRLLLGVSEWVCRLIAVWIRLVQLLWTLVELVCRWSVWVHASKL